MKTARELAHSFLTEYYQAHCSAPHEELGVCHDYRCDALTEEIRFRDFELKSRLIEFL